MIYGLVKDKANYFWISRKSRCLMHRSVGVDFAVVPEEVLWTLAAICHFDASVQADHSIALLALIKWQTAAVFVTVSSWKLSNA